MILPYTYIIQNLITNEFYYGSRFRNVVPAKQDLGVYYFSSSKYLIANQKKVLDPAYINKLKKPKRPGHGANVSKATIGIAKSESHRRALSIAHKGIPNTRIGMSYVEQYGEEGARALSSKLSKSHLGKNLGRTYEEIYGIKMATKLKNLRSISAKLTVNNKTEIICPHCKLVSKSIPNMSRWHFDNCKEKQ